MDKIIIFILRKLKKIVDNCYYNKYHLNKQEPLVRKMFPWITYVTDYRFVGDYLKGKDARDVSDLKKLILSFYWWEIAIATASKNFTRVEHLQVLVDFADSISDFHSEVLISNNNNENV